MLRPAGVQRVRGGGAGGGGNAARRAVRLRAGGLALLRGRRRGAGARGPGARRDHAAPPARARRAGRLRARGAAAGYDSIWRRIVP